MKLKQWIGLLAVLALALFPACGEKQRGGEESLERRTGQTAEETDHRIMPGDTVQLHLTVYLPRTAYLINNEAVVVLPPRHPGWEFEQTRYAVSYPTFPLIIPFKVTQKAPYGQVKMKLGLQITYADKADDSVNTHNSIIEVPLDISLQVGARRPATIKVPVEYSMAQDKALKEGKPK